MSVGSNAPGCCCGDGKYIVIKSMFEAAVNDLFASERFMRSFPQPGDGWSCGIQRCTMASNISYDLEWEAGFSFYIGDWVRDERRQKLPTSWACKPCGVQGTGNCGSSYDCEGNCTANCNGGYGANEVGQYGGFVCAYPGEKYMELCSGGCSCGCSGLSQNGPITCYDYCNEGMPQCGQDPTECVCFTNCNDPFMYQTKTGQRLSGWYGGNYAYKRKHHIKREGEWRFEYLETETSTETIFSKYRKCDGTLSTTNQSFEVQRPVDKYVAPVEGFPGTRTKGADCLCYSDYETRPGPNVGQDVQMWVGGQQYILFYHLPKFNRNYGIGIRKTSNSGTCNATYSVRTPDPSTLEIKRNGIVLGTVSLAQTATQINTAVRALTSNCVESIQATLAPSAAVPGEACVAPVDVIGPTTITTTSAANLIKTGWRVGSEMPVADFPEAAPRYEAYLHGGVDNAAATAQDNPAAPACDEWMREGPTNLGPTQLITLEYVDTAGTVEQFSRGFECIFPTPSGCFIPNIYGWYPNIPLLCQNDPAWYVWYPSLYQLFFPYVRGGPGNTEWPLYSVTQATPTSQPTARFDCGCKAGDPVFWGVCPWNDEFLQYAPTFASPRPNEWPNDAWNVPCPWDGTQSGKANVRPLGSNAVSQILYEDFGACNDECTQPNNEHPCECDTQDCGNAVVTDARTNMQMSGGCCILGGSPPGCPRCDIGFCGQSQPYPSPCYAVNGCRPECETPCFDKWICCCGAYQVPWYRQMRPGKWGGYAKTMGMRRSWSLTRVDA